MVFEPNTYSVLLVSASDKFNHAIMGLLPVSEYWPIEVVKSVSGARQSLMDHDYDLVLINAPLPDDFGLELSEDICRDTQSGVLLMVRRELSDEVHAEAVRFGVVTLEKPTNEGMLSQSLRVLCATRERMRIASRRQLSVEEKVKELRLVNRAKWLLIEHRQMTEPQAHRYLEEQAMERRMTKRQAAEEILREYAPEE